MQKRARPTEDLNFLNDVGVIPQSFVAGLTVECEVDAEDFVDKLSNGIEDEPARSVSSRPWARTKPT